MIAYEILVQTIADWKAGVRPSAPNVPHAPAAAGAPEVVEEYESGVVDLDEAYGEEQGYVEQGEQQYSEGEYATETYEDDEGQ